MPQVAKIFNRGRMKEIKRDIYLEKLISRRENGAGKQTFKQYPGQF